MINFIKFARVSDKINYKSIKSIQYFKVKYNKNPQAYYKGQKTLNGWIFDDTGFLQHRLTNPKNGLELVRELALYPEGLSHITALQFVYTNDLSYKSIIR